MNILVKLHEHLRDEKTGRMHHFKCGSLVFADIQTAMRVSETFARFNSGGSEVSATAFVRCRVPFVGFVDIPLSDLDEAQEALNIGIEQAREAIRKAR